MDLRKEFNQLIENEEGKGIGYWVLLRHFTNELSEFYDEITKEAIGGPKYKYNDHLIRVYSVESGYGMAMAADGITRVEPGDIPTEARIYYLKYNPNLVPKQGDIIYELGWRRKEKPVITFNVEEEDVSQGIVAPKTKNEVMKVLHRADIVEGELDYVQLFAEEHIL